MFIIFNRFNKDNFLFFHHNINKTTETHANITIVHFEEEVVVELIGETFIPNDPGLVKAQVIGLELDKVISLELVTTPFTVSTVKQVPLYPA